MSSRCVNFLLSAGRKFFFLRLLSCPTSPPTCPTCPLSCPPTCVPLCPPSCAPVCPPSCPSTCPPTFLFPVLLLVLLLSSFMSFYLSSYLPYLSSFHPRGWRLSFVLLQAVHRHVFTILKKKHCCFSASPRGSSLTSSGPQVIVSGPAQRGPLQVSFLWSLHPLPASSRVLSGQ